MIACPGCGFEAPDDSAFCSKCGTKLASPAAASRGAQDRHHPLLRPRRLHRHERGRRPRGRRRPAARATHAAARKVIESHGGTVEKFIGDAVVGVFGVPAVHEDDPERAVRAGLRIVEALEGMTRPDGSPLRGPRRRQHRRGPGAPRRRPRLRRGLPHRRRREHGGAPAGRRAARRRRRRRAHPRAHRSAPSSTRSCRRSPPRARPSRRGLAGDGARGSRRGVDVDATRPHAASSAARSSSPTSSAIFDKAVAAVDARSSPSSSASRASARAASSRELFAYVDARPEMITWRQGRCPPFGEGVTFWALGRDRQGHAGILDTDEPQAVEAKLEAVLPRARPRVVPSAAARAARPRGARRRSARRTSPPGCASSRSSPRADRRSSSSRTCTGPTRPCSPSSSTWRRTWPPCRCWSSAPRDRSSSSDSPASPPAAASTASPGAAVAGRDGAAGRGSCSVSPTTRSADGRARSSSAARATPSTRRSRRGCSWTRARQRRTLPDVRPGRHRRPSRRPACRAEGAPRDAAVVGERLLGRGRGGAGRARARSEVDDMLSRPARAPAGPPRPRVLDGGRARVRLRATRSPATSPTGHCRGVRRTKHAAAAAWLEAQGRQRVEDLAEVLAHHYVTALELAQACGRARSLASVVASPPSACLDRLPASRRSVAGRRRRRAVLFARLLSSHGEISRCARLAARGLAVTSRSLATGEMADASALSRRRCAGLGCGRGPRQAAARHDIGWTSRRARDAT